MNGMANLIKWSATILPRGSREKGYGQRHWASGTEGSATAE